MNMTDQQLADGFERQVELYSGLGEAKQIEIMRAVWNRKVARQAEQREAELNSPANLAARRMRKTSRRKHVEQQPTIRAGAVRIY